MPGSVEGEARPWRRRTCAHSRSLGAASPVVAISCKRPFHGQSRAALVVAQTSELRSQRPSLPVRSLAA